MFRANDASRQIDVLRILHDSAGRAPAKRAAAPGVFRRNGLRVLGLEQDLSLLAADDIVGRRLQDAQLQHRKRVARQPKEAA